MLSGQGNHNPEDTIVALATPPVPSERAIIRFSGPLSWKIATELVQGNSPSPPGNLARGRRWLEGFLKPGVVEEIPGNSRIPVALHLWLPGSGFTRQESVEMHLIGSPPLVEALIEAAVKRGARLARPGEFSMRAFLGGQIDLTQAEAIVAVSSARHQKELEFALERLGGGLRHPVEELRSDLLNLLADLEAGLDFVEEDISFVDSRDLLFRLASGMAKLRNLKRRMEERDAKSVRPQVALCGPPNAGKSTLFNKLMESSGEARALVSNLPGTTRDWLVGKGRLPGGLEIEWVDTAGLGEESVDDLDRMAQTTTLNLLPRVDLIVFCLAPGQVPFPPHPAWREIPILRVSTRVDETPGAPQERLAVSSFTGQGLDILLQTVEHQLNQAGQDRLPPLARCQAHMKKAEASLKLAHEHAMEGEPTEIVVLELRAALDAMGEMTGAIHTEDLLDRVFSRFCIGK